ncbi:MAG TPA: hypothetical protein VFR02_07750 [bacterium]|nr:hypothetical protein [bacterium]
MRTSLRKWWMAAALAALPALSWAGDRQFLYNYQSGVLGAGEREVETYSTYRFGRDRFYSALDQSLEFETGLGGGVQTSVYLNFTQELGRDPADGSGVVAQGPTLDGVSNEWKFKLADASADALGLGLYVEPEFEPDELDLELKAILDKKIGPFLAAFNLLAAPAFNYADGSSSFLLRPSVGLGAFVTGRLFLGLEAMDENFYDDAPLRSVFSMGPLVQYSGDNWWVGLTFLPQLASFGSPTLDFTDSQRDQVRLATSFSL